MKSLKINLAVFAVVLGLGAAFAFKAPAPKNYTQAWFSYLGSGDPTDPANYVEVGGQPSCPGTTTMCAILATNDGGSPDITPALQADINSALTNHRPSTDVKLKN
jgi:hypothetical protein